MSKTCKEDCVPKKTFDVVHIPGAVSPRLRNKCRAKLSALSWKLAPPAAASLLRSDGQLKPTDCYLYSDNGGAEIETVYCNS